MLSNGYGDCKDKNTLLAALLDAEGFKSTSVLIGSQRKLDPDVPSPMQFDHVITRVPGGRQRDLARQHAGGCAVPHALYRTFAASRHWRFLPDGKAELVWTPTEMPFDAFDRTSLTGHVSDTGKITAHVSIVSRGDNEMYFALRHAAHAQQSLERYLRLHAAARRAEGR